MPGRKELRKDATCAFRVYVTGAPIIRFQACVRLPRGFLRNIRSGSRTLSTPTRVRYPCTNGLFCSLLLETAGRVT